MYFTNFLLDEIGKILCRERSGGRREGIRSETNVAKRQVGLQVWDSIKVEK